MTAMEVFQHKGRKLVVVGDSAGRLTVVDREGRVARRSFETGVGQVRALRAHSGLPLAGGNVLFAGEHSVGSAKVLEAEVHQTACEAGSASPRIVMIEADVGLPGVVYAAVEGGDVYVFEMKSAGHIGFDCKSRFVLTSSRDHPVSLACEGGH